MQLPKQPWMTATGIWMWSPEVWDATERERKKSRILRQPENCGEGGLNKKTWKPTASFNVRLSLSLCVWVCISMSINGSAVSHSDRKVRDSVTLQLSAEPFLWHGGTFSFRHHGNKAEDNTVLSIAITQVSDWSATSTRRIISRSSLCSSSHGYGPEVQGLK